MGILPEQISAAESSEVARLHDKIDGLEEDLRSAIEVAWNRGATKWVKMNYPRDAERLEAPHKEG